MMKQFYHTLNNGNSQIAIDETLLLLKDTIRPGRSRVYADVDLHSRLIVTHLDSGDIEISLENIPDQSRQLGQARTLNDFRTIEVNVFGPDISSDDARAWRGGEEL